MGQGHIKPSFRRKPESIFSVRVADDRAGGKPPRYSPLGSKRHCLDASRQMGPQLVMPAKAGIHLGVHGNSDPKSGGQAPALRGHMRVSPTLQLCPGERSERLSQERPAVTRACLINKSLCVNLPFDRLRACPVPRYDTGANGIGKNSCVLRAACCVLRAACCVNRAA